MDPIVQSTIVSAIVGLLAGIIGTYLTYLSGKISLHDKLKLEYEYAERKKLKELIGKYRGRILEAAERLNHRLWNIHNNCDESWLLVENNYNNPDNNYYFTSTVYRTIHLYCLLRQFEKEAIFIDSQIAKDGELEFLKFAKALEWVLTDVDLFKGLKYDSFWQVDHLFRDKLQLLCDSCITGSEVISTEDFHKRLIEGDIQRLVPLLQFFDGLSPVEQRFRWDRLIALHLLLMAFINCAGYKVQHSSKEQFNVSSQKVGGKIEKEKAVQ